MRLVCPNCEAKYEVPEDAIPETGRDVQCANCGHAWYQMRPRAAVAEPAPATSAAVTPPAPEPVAEPAPEPAPEPEPDAIPEADLASAAPEPDVLPAEAPVEPEPEAAVEPEPPAPPAAPAPAAESPVEVTQTDAPLADAVEAVAEAVPEPAPEAEPPVEAAVPEAEPEPEVAPEAPATGEGVADAEDLTSDPEPAAGAAAAYAVDESVLAILREEAEREAQARRAEAARPLEVQPDLGIDAAMPAARAAAAAGAAAGAAAAGAAAGTLQESEDDAAERAAGRRTRLPDVEEINSTLRPSEVPVEDDPEPAAIAEAEGRSSFRSGFLLVLTIAILASAIYISADALARAVPALAGVLESYVSFINSLRLQMDGLMQSATVAINGTGG